MELITVGTALLAVMLIFLTHSEEAHPVIRWIVGLATVLCAIGLLYALLYPTDENVVALNLEIANVLDQTPPIIGISLLVCLFAWIHCYCSSSKPNEVPESCITKSTYRTCLSSGTEAEHGSRQGTKDEDEKIRFSGHEEKEEEKNFQRPEIEDVKSPAGQEEDVKMPENKDIKPSGRHEEDAKMPDDKDIKPSARHEEGFKMPENNDVEPPTGQFSWSDFPQFDSTKMKLRIKRQSQTEEIFLEHNDGNKENVQEKDRFGMPRKYEKNLSDASHQNVANDIPSVLDSSLPNREQSITYIIHHPKRSSNDSLSQCETVSNEGEQMPSMNAGDHFAAKRTHFSQDDAMERMARFPDMDLHLPKINNAEEKKHAATQISCGSDELYEGPILDQELRHHNMTSNNIDSLYPSPQQSVEVEPQFLTHQPSSEQQYPVMFCPCATCQENIYRMHNINFTPTTYNCYEGNDPVQPSHKSFNLSNPYSNHHQYSHQAVDVQTNVQGQSLHGAKNHSRAQHLHVQGRDNPDNRSTVESSVSWLQNKVESLHHTAKNDKQWRKRIFNGSVLVSSAAGSMLLRKSANVDALKLVHNFMHTFGHFLEALQESTWYAANSAHPTILGFLAASVYYSLSLLVKMISKETNSKSEEEEQNKEA